MSTPKQILQDKNLAPKKSFGQNFMMDDNINKKIVNQLILFDHVNVLEIGVGTGSLTKELLRVCSKLYGIEKDRDLANVIREQFSSEIQTKKFILFEENAAKFDLNRIFSTSDPGIIVANLPYHLTSSFILMVIKNFTLLSGAIFLIQKEVAIRLCSKKDQKNYGFLSVIIQLIFKIEKSFDVPKTCFWPVPKVDSAVITISKRKQTNFDIEKLEEFILFVKIVFQQRRKKLSSILRNFKEYNEEKSKTDLNLRPENLSPEDFYELFLAVNKNA